MFLRSSIPQYPTENLLDTDGGREEGREGWMVPLVCLIQVSNKAQEFEYVMGS